MAVVLRTLTRTMLLATIAVPAGLHAQATDYAALQDVMGEPVTNSVIGKPQRASAVPADVTIITRPQIALAAARDVPALLQRYAGIDVTRFTAGQTEIAIRGGVQPYNARLLVLVDGRQVYLDHYGLTDWNLLGVQLSDIQQIEIVRGPASALFGFNATAGVVNIITVDGFNARTAAVRAEVGDRGTRQIGATYAGSPMPDVSLRMSAGAVRQDERRAPAGYFPLTDPPQVTAEAISGTLTGRIGAGTRVVASAGLAWNTQHEVLPFYSAITRQRYVARHVLGQIDHDTAWGAINAKSYTNDLDAAYEVGTAQETVYRQRGSVSQASAIVRMGGGNSVRIGGEYRDSRLAATMLTRAASYRLAAATGMADLHPFPGVALSLAGRVDRLLPRPTFHVGERGEERLQAKPFTTTSLNAGLVVDLGAQHQLRINGGRGYRLPSLVDIGTINTVSALGYAVNPDAVWSVEGGYRRHIADALTVDAGLFWLRSEQSYGFFLRNVGSYVGRGGSLALSGSLAPGLTWQGNYTLTIVDDFGDVAEARLMGITVPRATPRHKGNLVVDYARGAWSGSVAARYTSATQQVRTVDYSQVEVRIPQAFALDAHVRLRLTSRLAVRALGENLTKARGANGAVIPADRRMRVGLDVML